MGFLSRMVVATRVAIGAPGYLRGLPTRPFPRRPSLREALTDASPRGAVIAEFKRRSPGAGTSRLPERTVASFVSRTRRAGVDAYSCLATCPEFGGSPRDVADLSGRTSRPVLYKDFVIDPVQLEAAARSGASAILLIARLEAEGLLEHPLRELAMAAHARGLEVLLEWHERSELRRTEDVPADVYGVNVRDLDSLRIDRATATKTIRAAAAFHPMVGMSGVGGPADARRFWEEGVDGLLVGTALARTTDAVEFLHSLRRPTPGGAA